MEPRIRIIAGLVPIALVTIACSAPSPAGPSHPAAASATAVSAAPSIPSATPVEASPLKLLWQKAGPAKVPTETYWPAIDPLTGNIWVASSFQDEYWIFKPSGTFVGSFGISGSGPGQFHLTTHDPHPDGVGAIAFAPDGSFYVADDGNYRVEKFDRSHHFVKSWGTFGTGPGQFVSPKGIATDGKFVYVADDSRGDMQVFDKDGNYLRVFPFPFILFSLSPNGRLIVSDNEASPSRIEVWDGSGHIVAQYPVDFAHFGPNAAQAGSPIYAAQPVLERSGSFLIGFGNDAGPVGLLELDPRGNVVRRWSTGSETLALAPDGKAVYEAWTGPSLTGWPYIRKYALP